ncbi:MAG: T9SS type A sorting domain-containing protein, partial [Bacteroidetes bacterium]|nr:T9SS type A sorting domain-containing protein [Bacteroidota bacterium]
GADFLSDTSLAIADDTLYAWGIKVASQAFRFFTWSGVVSVERENNLFPDEYSLSQNYPNPFNPSTTIKFSVPQQSNVVLRVYDILGSEVANLVNETLDAGNYTINFDASQFASGMYIYTLTAGDFTTSKKMMLLK